MPLPIPSDGDILHCDCDWDCHFPRHHGFRCRKCRCQKDFLINVWDQILCNSGFLQCLVPCFWGSGVGDGKPSPTEKLHLICFWLLVMPIANIVTLCILRKVEYVESEKILRKFDV